MNNYEELKYGRVADAFRKVFSKRINEFKKIYDGFDKDIKPKNSNAISAFKAYEMNEHMFNFLFEEPKYIKFEYFNPLVWHNFMSDTDEIMSLPAAKEYPDGAKEFSVLIREFHLSVIKKLKELGYKDE
jgi:hypothetical protein